MDQFVELALNIKREFSLLLCFLCNRRGDKLVLSDGNSNKDFLGFLKSRLAEKDDHYFSEVRFFRYRNSKNQAQEHLALIPVKLDKVPFSFLGMIYPSMENLDQMLKSRLLPAYLTHWLKTLVVEQEVAKQKEEHVQRLVHALEEKRQYTSTLESKVTGLKQKIKDIKDAQGGKDVEIFALRELLESHVVEYQSLTSEYKKLFMEFENLENEYLATVVNFETQVHLRTQMGQSSMEKKVGSLAKENQQLKIELAQEKAKLSSHQEQFQKILANLARCSMDELKDFQIKLKKKGFVPPSKR